MTKRFAIAALLVLLLVSSYGFGQVNAVLTGTVSDATGALIPGVEVVAKNINTGITDMRLTNESGGFVFPSLQPGSYTLSATLSGFQTATYNNVVLGQGQQVRLNFTLQVAAAATAVEVQIAADTLIATTSASIGNVLPDSTVTALPLADREVLGLISTAPGVITTVGTFGGPAYNFGGTPIGQVNTTRDGLTTNDGRYNNSNGAYSAVYTSPDMVEEVRITANNIDPAVGRGSAQVQMLTRSGGNDFHGALFYSNNNSKFTSQPWFSNLVGATPSYQNRNQFGGRLGGPIKKNKAFFFVLIDDQRFLSKVNTVATVLTPAARAGIFTYLTQNATGANGGISRKNGNALTTTPSVDINGNILKTDPTTGQPLFVNTFNVFTDVNDPNRRVIDQVWFGTQYFSRMPLPNDWTVGDGLNTAGFRWRQPREGEDGATGQSPNPKRNHLTTRFDYQINANNKVTYTMSREKDWGVTGQTGLPDYPAGVFGQVKRVPDFYTASWTSTVSSSILNEFRFGIKRDTWQGTSPLDRDCCWSGAKENDIDKLSQEVRASFPSVGGQFIYVAQSGLAAVGAGMAYAPFGVASPRQSVSPFKQISDSLSFTKGAHSYSVGFSMNWTDSHGYNHGGQQTTRPNVTLGNGTTSFPTTFSTTTFRGLNAADLTLAQSLLSNLSGTVSTVVEQYFVNSPTATGWSDYRSTILFQRDQHQNDWNVFFRDNWKVTKNLTLNLGMRYDKYGVAYDSLGLGGRFTGGAGGKGGQAALFGCSGSDFSALWNPNAGCDPTKLTTTEFVGKGSPQPGKQLWNDDWKDFGPSFGFSYNVPGLKGTVIRGGYGINYAGAPDFLGYNGNIGNLPGQTLNVTYTPSAYLDLAHLSASVVPVPLPLNADGTPVKPFQAVPFTNRSAFSITGYADDRRVPYIQSFNFSIQRELARNYTLDLSWVGNKATRLYSNTQLNYANVFENGILDAFLVTRAGGDASLFQRMLNGLNLGNGVVNGTTLTGSQALRANSTTNAFLANGNVGGLANYLNTTTTGTNSVGGILRNAGLPENYIVVNPQFNGVSLAGNNSNSTYHSFQSVLAKRLSSGLYSQVSYVFSKALGDSGVRDARNRQLSKGLLDIDRTHIFKINGTYELPFGPNRTFLANANSIVKRVVESWQLSSSFQWVSGSALSFTGIADTKSNQGLTGTPDLIGKIPSDLGSILKGNGQIKDAFGKIIPAGNIQYFSQLAACAPSDATDATRPWCKNYPVQNFGNDTFSSSVAGRLTNQVIVDANGNVIMQNASPGTTGTMPANLPGFTGPSALNWDLALTKKVRISEGKTFSLRADAVNVLNKPIWGNPNTNINSTSFGRITTATGNRTVTFNARVDF